MSKEVYKMLRQAGMQKKFLCLLILRCPFDYLFSALTANMLCYFIKAMEEKSIFQLVQYFFGFLALCICLFSYNGYVWRLFASKVTVQFQAILRENIVKKMTTEEASEIEKESTGKWMTLVNRDLDLANSFLNGPVNFMHGFIAFVNIVISSIVLNVLSVKLSIISILCIIPYFFISHCYIMKSLTKLQKQVQHQVCNYTNWLEPVIKSAETIEVYDANEFILCKIERESKEILKVNMQIHRKDALQRMLNMLTGNIGYLMLLIFGASMIGTTIEDFGTLTKITQYRANLFGSVAMLIQCLCNMKRNYAGVLHVNEALKEE